MENREYLTKEEAAARCKAFAAARPGTTFSNYATHKVVRRPTTESERAADRAAGGPVYLDRAIYSWIRIPYDHGIILANPSLKGKWILENGGTK